MAIVREEERCVVLAGERERLRRRAGERERDRERNRKPVALCKKTSMETKEQMAMFFSIVDSSLHRKAHYIGKGVAEDIKISHCQVVQWFPTFFPGNPYLTFKILKDC